MLSPIKKFSEWLNTYKMGDTFDRGDMVACWYASEREMRSRLATAEAALRAFMDATATGQKGGIVEMCSVEGRVVFYEHIAKARAQAGVALAPAAEREGIEKKEQT